MFNFAVAKHLGHKIPKKEGDSNLKKKSVLSQITSYLEDDRHKPVDFNQETVTLACQLKKFTPIKEDTIV